MVTHCVHRNTQGRGLCAFLLWKQDLLLPGPLWLAVVSCCHGEPLYPNRLHNASLWRPPVIRALVLKSAISCKERRYRKDQPGHQTPAAVSSPVHHCQNTHCCRPTTLTRPCVFRLVINSAKIQCAVPITRTINTWYAPGFSEHKRAVILSLFLQFVSLWL